MIIINKYNYELYKDKGELVTVERFQAFFFNIYI